MNVVYVIINPYTREPLADGVWLNVENCIADANASGLNGAYEIRDVPIFDAPDDREVLIRDAPFAADGVLSATIG
jgi:hypothetical protein